VRLIIPDRPGFGLSSFKPKRTLLDWPADVIELADALGLGRFAVAGVSGGGPFTAACAYKIGLRLTAVGLINSAGPMTAPEATAGMDPRTRLSFQVASLGCLPWWALYPSMVAVVRLARRRPEKLWQRAVNSSPQIDRTILLRPDVKAILLDSLPEAYRQGPRGHIDDALLIARDWGFALEEISVPTFLWHGTADVHASPAMGRYLAQTIPSCQATFVPAAGHFLMFQPDFWRDMLSTLISAVSP
jgi:pimeloyl-ACP methyl ester carboxylesterase